MDDVRCSFSIPPRAGHRLERKNKSSPRRYVSPVHTYALTNLKFLRDFTRIESTEHCSESVGPKPEVDSSAVVHLIRGSSWRTNQMARLTTTGVVAGQPNERGSDEPDIHSRPSRGARFYLPQIRASESGITTNLRLVVLVSG
jgi:hypothetical protein